MTQSQFNSLSIGDMLVIDGFPPAVVEVAYYQGGQFKAAVTIAEGLTVPLTYEDTFGHNWQVIHKPNTSVHNTTKREGWDS